MKSHLSWHSFNNYLPVINPVSFFSLPTSDPFPDDVTEVNIAFFWIELNNKEILIEHQAIYNNY